MFLFAKIAIFPIRTKKTKGFYRNDMGSSSILLKCVKLKENPENPRVYGLLWFFFNLVEKQKPQKPSAAVCDLRPSCCPHVYAFESTLSRKP